MAGSSDFQGPGRRAGSAVTLLLCLALGACTSSADKPDPEPPQTALKISVTEADTSLPSDERARLQSEVGDVLSRYVVTAFLGDYPRDDFIRALDAFSTGAARRAAEDLELVTAARYADADSVAARRLVARISPFAPRGRALGATARVAFEFEVLTAGGEVKRLHLRGRLMLEPVGDDWKIFGYDLAGGSAPAHKAEAAS